MNRKQRRQAAKAGANVSSSKAKTYCLSLDQITKIKEDASADAMEKAFVCMLGFPLMVLRDKFEFGKVRLGRFSEGVLELWDSFMKGRISMEDLHRIIYEETGVTIRDMQYTSSNKRII